MVTNNDTPRVDALMAKWDDDGAARGLAFVELRDLARELEQAASPAPAAQAVDARLARAKSALDAIANRLDDHELRAAAKAAYDEIAHPAPVAAHAEDERKSDAHIWEAFGKRFVQTTKDCGHYIMYRQGWQARAALAQQAASSAPAAEEVHSPSDSNSVEIDGITAAEEVRLLTALERLLERFMIVYGEPASGAVPHEVTIAQAAIRAAKGAAMSASQGKTEEAK